MTPTPSTDRRSYPRRDTRSAAVQSWVSTAQRNRQRCRIVEISRKGVFVKSTQSLRSGAKVQLFLAYRKGPKVTQLFRRWARVTRCTANGFAAVFVTQKRPSKDSRQNATR